MGFKGLVCEVNTRSRHHYHYYCTHPRYASRTNINSCSKFHVQVHTSCIRTSYRAVSLGVRVLVIPQYMYMMAEKQKPRLTYFAGRGYGEPIRLSLSAAGIEIEDIHMQTREEFLQLIKDGKLMFQQVPLLEIDGKNLIGAMAALRYVCRKGNQLGRMEDEAQIDMLCMGAKDMMAAGLIDAPFTHVQESPAKGKELLAKGVKMAKQRYLPVFEKTLTASSSGFLVGDSMTMADILVFDALCYLHEDPALKSELDSFPKCRAFIDLFSGLPGIKEYLSSDRRTPLTGPVHAIEVCEILGFPYNKN